MMFILCHACGAPQPGACYPECPITASLVEADRRERETFDRFLHRSRRAAGEQGPASRTARWAASTPEAIKRVLDAQKGLAS